MCTATWHTADGRFRLYFNRDELRSRGPALPPHVIERDGIRVAAPFDGDHGGSWIAANDAGLVVCLLNGYVEEQRPGTGPEPPSGGWRTRGELVFEALRGRDLGAAQAAIEALPIEGYRTFVLAIFDAEGSGLLARWLDGKLRIGPLDPAAMPLSSSSFDTVAVIERRRARWERDRPGPERGPHAAHLAYHASREPDSGAHSVCMSRPDAATRSFTWVEVGTERVALHYLDAPPCEAAETTTVVLERR